MNNWATWLALIGGLLSIIAQFAGGWYGALLGGVLSVIGAIALMMAK